MTDLPSHLGAILARDLAALRREIEAYPDDALPWRELPGLTNTGGTLALHVAGNLQHFVGHVLGGSGYVRDRPAEFARRGVPRSELVAELDRARAAVLAALPRLTPATLGAPFPEALAGHRFRTDDLLLHLATHLAYHLGQVDYHRRAVTGSPSTIGAMALPELASASPTG